MKRAGRFGFSLFQAKPKGLKLSQYPILGLPQPAFSQAQSADTASLMYAALLTLGEALRNIRESRSTWASTKLYYSCFYSLKTHLYLDDMVVFHSGKTEYLLDTRTGFTQELGSSSHNFSWNRITNIARLSQWMYSDDSAHAYGALRLLREDANYNNDFLDPEFIAAFSQVLRNGVERSFRTYKEDSSFTYTYLADHRSVAYPVKLASDAARRFLLSGGTLPEQQVLNLTRLWPFRDVGLW